MAATTQPQTDAALGSLAEIVERQIHAALADMAAQALWWQAIKAQAAALHLSPSQIIPAQLAQANDAQADKADQLRDLVARLHAQTAALQPWRTKADPTIHWAIVKVGEAQPLGLVWLVPALWIVGSAIVASAGIYLAQAEISAQQTAADARKLDAQTRAAIASSPAAKDPRIASALLAAMKKADDAAKSGIGAWLEEAAATAAKVTGAGIGAAAILLLALAYGRRKR